MWDESGFEADDRTMWVRDVLAHLYMFDFGRFRSNQPVMGYSSKAKVSVEYRARPAADERGARERPPHPARSAAAKHPRAQ